MDKEKKRKMEQEQTQGGGTAIWKFSCEPHQSRGTALSERLHFPQMLQACSELQAEQVSKAMLPKAA